MPAPETNSPTPIESTAYPTFHGYKKKKKPHYPYYPNYTHGKGKKSKGSQKGYYYYGKGYGSYYGKGNSKNSKSKKSKSKSSNLSSSGYEKEGNGGKGVHLFHHKTPADGSLDNGSYHKERAQELHVTKTGGGHQREPVQSVFHERREGGA